MIISSSASTITKIDFATSASRTITAIGSNSGSNTSGFLRYERNGDLDKFFGFTSQNFEDEVRTLASIAPISYDKVCLQEYRVEFARREELAEIKRQQEEEEERLRREREEQERLEQEAIEAEVEVERLRAEKEAAEALARKDDDGSNGGAIAAVIIILLLLIGGAVWFWFSDKACFCWSEKIRICKTKSKNWLNEKRTSLCSKKNKSVKDDSTPHADNDSSRAALKVDFKKQKEVR